MNHYFYHNWAIPGIWVKWDDLGNCMRIVWASHPRHWKGKVEPKKGIVTWPGYGGKDKLTRVPKSVIEFFNLFYKSRW